MPNARTNAFDAHGKGALYRAACTKYSRNYTKLLRDMLKTGALAEPANPLEPKPFNAVLENGDLASVKLMIKYGIRISDYADFLPLHRAARNPRVEVLRCLLSTRQFNPNQMNKKGQTALFQAVSSSNSKAVEILLSWGVLVNSRDADGDICLHHVPYHKDSEETTRCLEILLRHGANPDALNQDNTSPLILASASKYNPEYTKRLKLCLENRVEHEFDHSKFKAVASVIRNGDLQAFQLIMKHVSIDLYKSRDQMPEILQKAAANPRVEILEFLLGTGLFDLDKKDEYGWTALHVSANKSNPQAMEVLLKHNVMVNPVDSGGFTPLHLAVNRACFYNPNRDASVKCIEILLIYGADINAKTLMNGWTALGIAQSMELDYYRENQNISDGIMKILMHANLLRSQGQYVDLEHFSERNECQNQCCLYELAELKTETLGDMITLYDLLVGESSWLCWTDSKEMQKLRDHGFVGLLEDRFPIYGKRLVRIVEDLNLNKDST
ncbi:hypothetical protein QAD02_019694 [Eretmocerus hayati]|uniref:Uncharacterized protein n=1 Tax=Eretmocerus hayati TaxID=131215 RepID=A0ACC2PKK5_9HYME|nr:hypothetical protein QAD02_019694 [Eretmocerus hayati]